MAQARPPLAYLSEITPQPTLPAFAAYGDQIASTTPQPKRFTADDWRDTGDLRGKLAGYGEKYLGMSPQQANTVFGAGADAPLLSISDITPGLDTALAINDAKLAYDRGDYLGMGLSALGALPLAAVGYKLGKGAFKAGKEALSVADEVAPAARKVLPEAASRVTDISPRVTNRVQVGGEQNAIGLPPWRLPANAAAIGSLGVLGAGMAMPDEAQAGPLDKAGQAILRAFHSSPHRFDKFEWSPRTARTGEGGAAFGEGLYLAENPAVSGRGGQYWNQFLRKFEGPERDIATRFQEAKFDPKAVTANMDEELAWLEYNVKHATSPEAAAKNLKLLNETQDALRRVERGEAVGPHTYEVGIRARPEDLLDWDKPIAGQPAYQKVREHWDRKVGDPDILAQHAGTDKPAATGATLYRALGGIADNKAAATDFLKEAGIPGHRFLDQGSRNQFNVAPDVARAALAQAEKTLAEAKAAGDPRRIMDWTSEVEAKKLALDRMKPTHNYVIWQPEILDILKRYGGAGAAPLAGLGAYGASRQEPAPPVY